MAEYIEREALLARLKFKLETDNTYNHLKYRGLESAMAQVRKAPAADVVEVVRCKDCKHSELYFFADNGTTRIEQYKCVHHRMGVNVLEPDDFCAYGERKETD